MTVAEKSEFPSEGKARVEGLDDSRLKPRPSTKRRERGFRSPQTNLNGALVWPLPEEHAITLHLGYCTNCFPSESLEEVESIIRGPGKRLADATHPNPIGLGLYFTDSTSRQLFESREKLDNLARLLRDTGIECRSLNAFPFGGFHQAVVKEKVYRPNWLQRERLEFTKRVTAILAALMPENSRGAISTVAGGFKPELSSNDDLATMSTNLRLAALECARVLEESGRHISIALEPEPYTTLETTDEAIALFRDWIWKALEKEAGEEAARNHLGICYDACHQAVIFESASESLGALKDAGVPIAKMQLSNALEFDCDEDSLRALKDYLDERYLHQTYIEDPQGEVTGHLDLKEGLSAAGESSALRGRTHFHLPLYFEKSSNGMRSTNGHLEDVLAFTLQNQLCEILEIETYTWDVLPEAHRVTDPVEGMLKEIEWVRARLDRA